MNNTSGIIFLSDDSGGENEIALTDKQQLHIEEVLIFKLILLR